VIALNKKRKVVLTILLLLVVVILAPFILMIPNPMRRPQEMARDYILRLTPMGTHIDDVVTIMERNGYGSLHVNLNSGFRTPPPSPHDARIGVMSASIGMGNYYLTWYRWFHTTEVGVFWGFDEDGKLIDVYVRKVWG
jgi:ABC-type glycerol-3-phosphate transport system permease component